MRRTAKLGQRAIGLLLWLAMSFALGENARAQTEASQQPVSASASQSAPAPQVRSLEKHFLRDFLHDEKAIWTSPFHVRLKELKWVLPLAATTAVLIVTDRRATGEMRELVINQPAALRASQRTSNLGSPVITYGLAGGMYVIGRFTHDDRLRETGLLGAAALLHTSIVTNVFKAATNRQRPDKGDGCGRFWTGGKSFPSGHASTSWALATVIAHEYHDKPLIRWGAYGVAAAVSASRVTGLKHYPSDVVIGGALGFLIGRYIVREHSARDAGGVKTTLYPYLQPATRAAGMGVTWSF